MYSKPALVAANIAALMIADNLNDLQLRCACIMI